MIKKVVIQKIAVTFALLAVMVAVTGLQIARAQSFPNPNSVTGWVYDLDPGTPSLQSSQLFLQYCDCLEAGATYGPYSGAIVNTVNYEIDQYCVEAGYAGTLPVLPPPYDCSGDTGGGTDNSGGIPDFGPVPDYDPGFLQNWLAFDTVGELVQQLLELVVLIGVPLVALAIIWAGFQFVAAQGNQEKLTKARQTLLWTLVGAVLVLGANVFAKAIGGTVAELVQ